MLSDINDMMIIRIKCADPYHTTAVHVCYRESQLQSYFFTLLKLIQDESSLASIKFKSKGWRCTTENVEKERNKRAIMAYCIHIINFLHISPS